MGWRHGLLKAALVTAPLCACGSVDGGPTITEQPKDSVIVESSPGYSFRMLPLLGTGVVSERLSSEVAQRSGYAYTGTYQISQPEPVSNVVKVWNVSGLQPLLIDSLVVENAHFINDIATSDDGKYLLVATQVGSGGAISLYDIASPAKPRFITEAGYPRAVHTAKFARVDNKLYVVANLPASAEFIISQLTESLTLNIVSSTKVSDAYVHDVFARDGILFTAQWQALVIWDIGGGGKAGTPTKPIEIGRVSTPTLATHNVWWYHDGQGGKRYAFVGEEMGGALLQESNGPIYAVDVSDLSKPKVVASYEAPDSTTSNGKRAGSHNFTMDESKGLLIAAFYNGGVRVLDVSGDLGRCTVEHRASTGLCDLRRMGREVGRGLTMIGKAVYVWGVQYADGKIFASDMLNGLQVLDASSY